VALSRGSPRVAVSDHPALRSPDFPRHPALGDAAAARPARSSPDPESNGGPSPYHGVTLPTELPGRVDVLRRPWTSLTFWDVLSWGTWVRTRTARAKTSRAAGYRIPHNPVHTT
jgi:hypothetical protein